MDSKAKDLILLIVLAVAILISIAFLQQQKAEPISKNYTIDTTVGKKAGLFAKAPELTGISGVINGMNDLKLESLKGKVVLLDFWTYSCINCIRTLPYLKAWHEKYKKSGFEIVGVHTPEFEFEKSLDNVKKAVEKYNVSYPVVLDNNYSTWTAFNNHYWPHHYLIDADGFIRFNHIGEGNYEETEEQIQTLLKEKDSKLKLEELIYKNVSEERLDLSKVGTPEIYFGFAFARQPLGNQEGFKPNENVNYSQPKKIQKNLAYLEGVWKNNFDSMELELGEGRITLLYKAKNVNIVTSGKAILEIQLDGKHLKLEELGLDAKSENNKTIVKTYEERMYNIVKDKDYFERTITITAKTNGFKIYTFTFG